MSISLQKGENINLSKQSPRLREVMVGLGWELKPGETLDLDVSVFMLNANGKIPADEYFVFYNNLKSPDGSVQHTGDNRTGAGDGDDEIILVNLTKILPIIQEVIFVVSIYEASTRVQDFGALKEAYIRLVNVENGEELAIFDLDEEFTFYTEMEFGRLHRIGNEWHFKATGIGSNIGLQGYINKFV
ncbi:MAG: TerD family protein [Cytophagales bacterium]|nr:TerD family protein [Cytophagales bacterium]MDW8384653.1 TerD family protein [Flammeovirgaceae bacterium]